jgi:hypothetical protein
MKLASKLGMNRQRCRLAFAAFLFSLLSTELRAATLTLAWDPSANATGYILAYGTSYGSHTTQIDVGATTQKAVTGLADGTMYYFAVKAYGATGLQSPFSAEISGATPLAPITPVPSLGFAGNRKTSLLLEHGSGMLQAWGLNGVTATGLNFTPSGLLDPNWKIVGAADFNNDGYPDLLLQHAVTGGLYLWYMSGSSLLSSTWLSPNAPADANWKVAGLADFNGDGRPDVLFQHSVTGLLAVWYMNGTTAYGSSAFTPGGPTDPAWKVVSAFDFNGDGKPDLLLQNKTTSVLILWYMNGVNLSAASLFSPTGPTDTNWKVAGVADLNGDGKPDLVLQHATTAALFAWYLNGTTVVGGVSFSPAAPSDPSWKIVAVK